MSIAPSWRVTLSRDKVRGFGLHGFDTVSLREVSRVRTLGVNVKSDVAYLAVAEGSSILDLDPGQLRLPAGVEESQRLTVFQEEVRRLLESLSIARVCVLAPEVIYSADYKTFLPRITIETLILAAAVHRYGERMSRARCRSLLGLPRGGTLVSHVGSITPQVGKMWKDKRDLAALAALACAKEAE